MSNALDRLLPRPRRAAVLDTSWRLPPEARIYAEPGAERAARFLKRRLHAWKCHSLQVESATEAAIRLRLDSGGALRAQGLRAQGYRLEITSDGVEITGGDAAGTFYGVCTLVQWLALAGWEPVPGAFPSVPGLRVEDHPDFAHRGVMLDISRNRVPTVETVEALVDLLAGWKINQLQLYMEHTFAYPGHETVWREASPWTANEIRRLDAFCRERHVELVPNQNSFGHFHRWLIHEPYRQLAECPDGVDHPFSPEREPFSLCPIDPGSLVLLRDLYAQLLPNFSSHLFNVGLDETLDLGQGRSARACAERGRERVYVDFLQAVQGLAAEQGKRMMFWGDVILARPEWIDALPRDAIALEWGYEADHPFAADAARFAASGLDFYVCPGTSSWNSLAGRTHNAVLNLANAAFHGREHGALGYLITDWGDHGHLQPLPVSYPGFIAGAAFAWSASLAERPLDLPLATLLDLHVYRDRAGILGRLTLDLGEVYRLAGGEPKNGSALFFLMFFGPEELEKRQVKGVRPRHLRQALAAMAEAAVELPKARSAHDEAEVWRDEFDWLIKVLGFACRFGIERLGKTDIPRAELQDQLDTIIERFQIIWRRRHREGGLADSVARLEALRRWL